MPFRDRFLHQLPTTLRQRPYAAPAQIPQAFVSVARVNKNDAFTCGRVVKGCTRMFRDKLKERLPPGPIRLIKHLFAKFSQFFNVDNANRFRDGLPSLVIDCVNVLEFFEWHRPLIGEFQQVRTESIIFDSVEQGKGTNVPG